MALTPLGTRVRLLCAALLLGACGGGDDAPGGAAHESAAVVFTPAGGGFAEPFELELAASAKDATIFYTLDGSLPTSSSRVYADPIAIMSTTLVRAIAVYADGTSSSVVQHVYLQLEHDVQAFSSNLPVIVVHLLGREAPDPRSREYVPAHVSVFRSPSGRTRLLQDAEHTSRAGIKVRGRSTRFDDKSSYTFELWGAAREDAKLPLLGLPADGDWVLYAPYRNDRSLMRNARVYALSNDIGRYAPRTRFCELFVVTEAERVSQDAYRGVYMLTERLERSDDRIDVARLLPSDVAEPAVTGGYVFQKNDSDTPGDSFSAAGDSFQWVDPNAEDVRPEQRAYITAYIDSVKRAVEARDGTDPVAGRHYTELLDSASFIDHHILNTLAKNPDAMAFSAYFHKDRGEKLRAGPVWDFDLSMGANDPFGERSRNPRGWDAGPNDTFFDRGFYPGLFRDPEFERAYFQRFAELLRGPLAIAEIRAHIGRFAAELTEAEARNRERWPEAAPRNESYDAEVAALEQWLEDRIRWLEDLGELP